MPRLIGICTTQWWCPLFSVLGQKHPFSEITRRGYCLCDRTGVETLKQIAVVNAALLFCQGGRVRGLFLCTAFLKDLKRKQTFYFT